MATKAKRGCFSSHSKYLLGALRRCIDSAKEFPTTLHTATEAADVIRVGKAIYRVDVAIVREEPDTPNAGAVPRRGSDVGTSPLLGDAGRRT